MANGQSKIGGAYVEITADTTGLKAGMSEAEVVVKRADGSLKGLQRALGSVTRAAGLAGAAMAAAFGVARAVDSFANSAENARIKLDSIGESARNFAQSIAKAFSEFGPKTTVQKQITAMFEEAGRAGEDALQKATAELTSEANALMRSLGLSATSRQEIIDAAYEAGNMAAKAANAGAARAKDADRKASADRDAKAISDAISRQQAEIRKAREELATPSERAAMAHNETIKDLFVQLKAATDHRLKDLIVQRINLEYQIKAKDVAEATKKELEDQARAAERLANESERSAIAAAKFRDAVAQARIESERFQDRQQAGFGLGDIHASLDDLKTAVRSLAGQIR